ncbi:hypothetical protein OROHE_005964 [Orobanche hederae]
MGKLPSSATGEDVKRWRTRFQIPSDVHLYVLAENERVNQPPEGMVALSEMVLEAGLRLPLPFAVSHLLSALNLAPLQLTPNTWLQIVNTLTLYGNFRLYRHLSPTEMVFLFKVTAQRGTFGGYHFQGRSGKVILGVPNKACGDPAKWFWVSGAWRSETPGSNELDIPTDFREKNPSFPIPSESELCFDFSIVQERIKSLPDDQLDARLLNTEAHRLSARLFCFPRHLRVPDIHFPRVRASNDKLVTMKKGGVLEHLKTVRTVDQAPGTGLVTIARNAPEIRHPVERPAEDPAVEAEEEQFHRKRRRVGETSRRPASVDRPIATIPLKMKGPMKSKVVPEAIAISRVETSRGKPYFGRDLEKVERIRQDRPQCSPMVLDFLSSKPPRVPSDVPTYVSRAASNLPKAWTTDLNVVARRPDPEATQAALVLTLQAAAMLTQAVRDAKDRSSADRLQADLEAERRTNAELSDRLAVVEKKVLGFG